MPKIVVGQAFSLSGADKSVRPPEDFACLPQLIAATEAPYLSPRRGAFQCARSVPYLSEQKTPPLRPPNGGLFPPETGRKSTSVDRVGAHSNAPGQVWEPVLPAARTGRFDENLSLDNSQFIEYIAQRKTIASRVCYSFHEAFGRSWAWVVCSNLWSG